MKIHWSLTLDLLVSLTFTQNIQRDKLWCLHVFHFWNQVKRTVNSNTWFDWEMPTRGSCIMLGNRHVRESFVYHAWVKKHIICGADLLWLHNKWWWSWQYIFLIHTFVLMSLQFCLKHGHKLLKTTCWQFMERRKACYITSLLSNRSKEGMHLHARHMIAKAWWK